MLFRQVCFGLLALLALIVCSLPLAAAPHGYGDLPLVFEPNQGQTDASVRYLSRGNGYSLFLTDSEAILSIARPEHAVVKMRLAGQNKQPVIDPLERQAGVSNYFRGSDPLGWQESVPHFSKVQYRDVYPGIDLQYYGNQHQLEYDFRVAPGANPSLIAFDFSGINGASIRDNGELTLDTPAGVLTHQRPVAYQERNGARELIAARFVMRGENRVGFEVGGYDHSRPLVIDPVLVYSSYFGGTDPTGLGDQGNGIAVDAAGNAYIAGVTSSTDFNGMLGTPAGGLDAFILKLDASGKNILASSYFGGSGDDEAHRLALDGSGNIYITGYTSSTNFPVKNASQSKLGGFQDAYLLKFNNDASAIIFSTYLGGSDNDRAYGLAVDPAGNAFVAGMTSSTNFPTASAFQSKLGGGLADAFVTKFSVAGSVIYSTYLGGRGNDLAYDVARDSDGNAYVTGFTTSIDFPVVKPLHDKFAGGTDDVFITELNPSGNALVFSTYWGGISSDEGVRLAVDADKNIYVTGYTGSLDFPTKNAIQPIIGFNVLDGSPTFDAFLIKLTPSGADVAFSTFLGGEDTDSGVAIAIDGSNNIYLAGFSQSFQFYVINAVQGNNHGGRDGYVMKLTPDGHILYSTYLGGSGNDGVVGLALDAAGNAYVTGYTTSASDFPIVNEFQPNAAGGQDGFISKINADDIKAVTQFTVPVQGGATVATSAQTSTTTFGYAAADVSPGPAAPLGIALIDLRQSGLLVTDLGLPLTPLLQNGRVYTEINGGANIGVAFVNPNADPVTINFDFTGPDGTVGSFGSTTLDPGKALSGFLNQDPFNLGSDVLGTFSFSATGPVSATAFRANSASSSQLVLTYIPVVDIDAPLNDQPTTVPEFSDGAGWSTQMILVNPTEEPMNGELRFFKGSEPGVIGHPTDVSLAQGDLSTVEYSVAPRSSTRFQTSGLAETLNFGYFQVVPAADTNTPSAFAILSYAQNGVTDLDTTVEAQKAGNDFTLYVESAGDFDPSWPLSARSAISVANPSDSVVDVTLELHDMQGKPTGLTSQLQLPPRGHTGAFLHELVGFTAMGRDFEGILHVTATGPGITIFGLRARYNEAGHFVATTTGPLKPVTGPVVFAHVVNGSGYATKIVLLNVDSGNSISGALRFQSETGEPLYVGLVPGNGFNGQ